jgi:hypothetical protein
MQCDRPTSGWVVLTEADGVAGQHADGVAGQHKDRAAFYQGNTDGVAGGVGGDTRRVPPKGMQPPCRARRVPGAASPAVVLP